jgi:hypothetical protein
MVNVSLKKSGANCFKILEENENENTIYWKLWDAENGVLSL